jgi:hypothetical protein
MMNQSTLEFIPRQPHSWLQQIELAYLPGKTTPLLDNFVEEFIQHFEQSGHTVKPQPDKDTDIILTTAPYGEPIRWREALLFNVRRRYHLDHSPTIFTLINASKGQFQESLEYYERVLAKEPPDPLDFAIPGLNRDAYRTLYEQGRRGGPILALIRQLQSQAMCIRIILVVGNERPLEAYTFDLVGAHPRTDGADKRSLYDDLMLRIVTSVSTREITAHQVVGEVISQVTWKGLDTPAAMRDAGRELGARNFFTEMVVINNLVNVPAVHDSISSQYSEGCFATWDIQLGALVATVTGSARPVDKGNLTDNELAVIVGVRPDGMGAQVRHVEGKRNDPPSSEAVELMEMDRQLPRIDLPIPGTEQSASVPVVRSKLHGHRGVRGYDPRFVEHVYLDAPYYHYPVSCSTEAQAHAIKAAFSRSVALLNPDDPRQIVFTVLPGHGTVIVEKWLPGKAPFQTIWEAMDAGYLQVDNLIPQGPLVYKPDMTGLMSVVST